MSTPTKRRELTLTEKLELLKSYDSLPQMSQREAAAELQISQSLLSKMLRNRTVIASDCLDNANKNRKRKRCGKDGDVENALKDWLVNAQLKCVRVNGPQLKSKAEELAKGMGKDNFCATNGWLYRWRKRMGVVYSKPKDHFDESLSAPVKSTEEETGMHMDQAQGRCMARKAFNSDEEQVLSEPHQVPDIEKLLTPEISIKEEPSTSMDQPEACTDGESSEDDSEPLAPPSRQEMFKALEVLRRGVYLYADSFHLQYQYEDFINDLCRKIE